jgi:DNA-binding transcriptional regulator LsrR (DeoR family)
VSAPRSVEALAEAAHLYYVEDLTQQQVAKALGTTRSNVSRMLRAAREQGIVRFQVLGPLRRQRALEHSLMETFGLTGAVVLSADAGEDSLAGVGELAAQWLVDHVKDGMRITLSWGRSLQMLSRSLHVDQAYDVDVVQSGGDLQLDPQYSGHELVREVAARLGGTYSYLHAPAILESESTVSELRSMRAIDAELEKARTADVALVGIGAYGHGFAAQLLESAHLSPAERAAMDASGAAGDILGRFFDVRGQQVDTPLRDRVLALELDELREVPTIVGIACGESKTRGIWGALRGGYVDVLITDQSAAAGALHLEREGAL